LFDVYDATLRFTTNREEPVSPPCGSESGLSVEIDEFVEFGDGERLSLRWDRGLTILPASSLTLSELHEHVDCALLPDESEGEDASAARSWAEYTRLLRL
ncbi:MAG: hypothetical protein Q4G34_10145, partial [Micrococcus sp.]|nr:hypothetical protein [Micrococcus sp.]